MTTGQNDTSTAFTPEGDSWRPLAIALPVCLLGIPLVTALIIVLITCYRTKYRHKENSVIGLKLKVESRDQNDSAEIENETGANRTGNPAFQNAVYANLSETVEEARSKELMGNNTSDHNSEVRRKEVMGNNTSDHNSEGRNKEVMGNNTSDHNGGIAKSLHWQLKLPWKKSQVMEIENATENTETDKDPKLKAFDYKDRRQDEAKEEEKAARRNGTELKWTHERKATETAGVENSPFRPIANGVGIHSAPMRRKKEPAANQNTDNPATTATKPSKADNRKTFVVMYSKDSEEANHLSLAVNDVIFFMDEEKDGMMKGEKKESGEIGWFPRTHVREGMSPLVKRHSMRVKTDTSSDDANKKPTTTTARATMATIMTSQKSDDNDAFEDFDDDDDDDDDYETGIEYQALYPYRATEDGDINFDVGDVIVVVEKQDNGWWRGYHGDDHGFFPGSYVQLLRSDELSQSLPNLSQITGESSGAAGDIGHLDDPDMLLPVAEEEEVDGDNDAQQQKQNKKTTMKIARKSIGDFLLSLPRRMATPNRPATDAGPGEPSSAAAAAAATGVMPPQPDPIKTKKSDRIIISGIRQKKNRNKNKKAKNGLNRGPMTRRSSLAPAPPQSGQQGAAVGALVKNAMSGLAQMVAAEAQLRNDPLNTTYEEIGTTDFFDATGSEANASKAIKESFYEDLPCEVGQPPNWSDVVTVDVGSTSQPASFVFGAKRNDVPRSGNQTTNETYSNLDSAVQLAIAKDNSNRRGVELNRTENNRHQRETKNRELPKQVVSSGRVPANSGKPVPPKKPRYIGSTPNIAELLSAMERRADGGVRRLPGNKPRPLAKPGRRNSGGGRGSDLGLTGRGLKKGARPLIKPKPLKAKPLYLSPGFPQGVAPKSDHQLQRRDIYRSLDSIMAAAEADDGTTDEDEAGEEPEIMRWLQKKLSAEDELTTGSGEHVVGRTEGVSLLNGGGKALQQMKMGRTTNSSNGKTENVETKNGSKIIFQFENLSKVAGLNEESFV